ncbi:MAG: hypothetical protein EZS28_020268, partial [Streblomastix strix]
YLGIFLIIKEILFDIVVGISLMFIAIANIGLFLIATSAYNTLTKDAVGQASEEEKTPINSSFYSRQQTYNFWLQQMSQSRSVSPSERISQREPISPRQSFPIIPAIVEVGSPLEKEQEKVTEQSVLSRRRSSIFEEIIVPDPSVCRWKLDIISEDERMTKEQAHFILSEHQLIRVIAYTFDVVENQVILNTEDEGCCGKFLHDGTRTLRDITINNVNILTLDIDNVNLLRDSYKICLQKVRKITRILDLGDISSKLMSSAIFDTKADKSDTYTKTETDTLFDAKADKSELIDLYSKTEDNALLLLKANVADLTNYVDLTSAQTIKVQKQFNVINVSSISKLIKNDASILLAGGGDMLVSTLVTQSYLQKVRDITTGKSKAYVFSTQGELNDWIAVQDNVAKLVIGDNLYIVGKKVIDYWWDGTDLNVLETELPDMSNVMTTLGTATGGVGIMVQTYDNSSVGCASGGVRSIADIQSETNNLLNIKADNGVSYTKVEDDALLLLKADKSTTYTKGETNNLLNNKAEAGVSYTKGETNNLLNNKANQSTTYTKTETDYLISQIDVGDVDLTDYYNKTNTDELLGEKADTTELYNYISLGISQTINVNKTFNKNINAAGFAKTGKDDTSVLLAGRGDMLLSAFRGFELVSINYASNVVSPTSVMSLKWYRYRSLFNFYGYIQMDNGAGASGASVAVCTLESAGFPKYLFYADDIVFAGSAPHVANFQFGTDGKVTITIKALSGTAGLAGSASAYINVTYPAAN